MHYVIEFGEGPEDMAVTLSGQATPIGFRQLIRDLNMDPRAHAGMTILVDLTALDTSVLSNEARRGSRAACPPRRRVSRPSGGARRR